MKKKIFILIIVVIAIYLFYDGVTHKMTFEVASKLQHFMKDGTLMDGPPMKE